MWFAHSKWTASSLWLFKDDRSEVRRRIKLEKVNHLSHFARYWGQRNKPLEVQSSLIARTGSDAFLGSRSGGQATGMESTKVSLAPNCFTSASCSPHGERMGNEQLEKPSLCNRNGVKSHFFAMAGLLEGAKCLLVSINISKPLG